MNSDTVHRKFDDMDTKARSIYCHNMKKKWSQSRNMETKNMTNSTSHGKLKDEIHGCMDSKL